MTPTRQPFSSTISKAKPSSAQLRNCTNISSPSSMNRPAPGSNTLFCGCGAFATRTRWPRSTLEHFLHDAEKQGITVLLAGLKPDFVKILDNVGLTKWFIKGHIFPEEPGAFSATLHAVRYAHKLIHEKAGRRRDEDQRARASRGEGIALLSRLVR